MEKQSKTSVTVDCAPAFDFSNCFRNQAIQKMGAKMPTLTSTGTTIVACVYKVCLLNDNNNYFLI